MTTDLNTLLTALYVWIDDYLGPRRRVGRPPRLTDAELLTLAVAQALLGVRSEARTIAGLTALRDHVIAPILAGIRKPGPGRPPATRTRVDRDYLALRTDMRTLLDDLGVTTAIPAAA